MQVAEGMHLSYCGNVHPAERWDEVVAAVERHVPDLKGAIAPDEPFGLGLRLSARAAQEALEGDCLDRFKDSLDAYGLYAFTLNGFPYGAFHRRSIKSQVFSPDWSDQRRVQYTLNLIEILRRLLPSGVEGGISTVPLSFKGWGASAEAMACNLALIAHRLVRLKQECGKTIHLDLEPEPGAMLETSEEVLRFYEDWLWPVGGKALATALGVSPDDAWECMSEHIRVCVDACHLAVEFEDPAEAMALLTGKGIRIGKIQLSSALRVELTEDRMARERLAAQLDPFAESTYLHQVISRQGNVLRYYEDLPEALSTIGEPGAREWRIHYHVPLFMQRFGSLHSTQTEAASALRWAWQTRLCSHLEIETYTWDVLPAGLKGDLGAMLAREYRWALDTVQPAILEER